MLYCKSADRVCWLLHKDAAAVFVFRGFMRRAICFDRLMERLKQKRQEKEEQEKREQIQREKLRRATGKDLTGVKQKWAIVSIDVGLLISFFCLTAYAGWLGVSYLVTYRLTFVSQM